MFIVRDLLDKQIVDREGHEMGRVDGIVAELRDHGPPVVLAFELGFVPLTHRISRRLESLIEAMHHRFSVRRSARYHLPWSDVSEVHIQHIRVDLAFDETAAVDWERWLRHNVIRRIPGSGE